MDVASAQRTSNLAKCLEEEWAQLHQPIMHHSCPAIEEADPTPVSRPLCHTIGLCICGAAGAKLDRMRKGFYNSLKAQSRKGSLGRQLLEDRKLLVKLIGETLQVDESPWAAAMQDDSLDGADQGHLERWWHISSHSFAPYRSTARVCNFRSSSQRNGKEEICLEALAKPKILWEPVRQFRIMKNLPTSSFD